MLSAVPFRADGVLYVLLYGATQQSVRATLHRLGSPAQVIFLHITDMIASELEPFIFNNVSHLGFGPEHSFVQPSPCGPRTVVLSQGDYNNYLSTIGGAVCRYLDLDWNRGGVFCISLHPTLRDLICYVGENGLAAQGSICTPRDRHNVDCRPVAHLSPQHQTYAEFVMLLQSAAEKRQGTMCSLQSPEHDPEDCPVYCFPEIDQFSTWVKLWIRDGERTSPGLEEVDQGRHSRSATEETLHPRTPQNFPFATTFERQGLASKKRKLDEILVSTSFYGPGDEADE